MKMNLKKMGSLIVMLTIISCGGGGKGNSVTPDSGGQMPDDETSSFENPTTSSQTSADTVTLSVRIELEDENTTTTSSLMKAASLLKAASIAAEVVRVYIEVIIDGTVYSTTDLTADASDPLIYTGSITIPVGVEVELHAVAVDAAGNILFEDTASGITATEYGSPSIELFLQRQTATEDTIVNSAPVIHNVYIGDQSVAYGESTNLSVEAEDPQDDALTYLWQITSAPEGADTSSSLTNADQQGATFTAPSIEGLYTVQVTVSDTSGATDTEDLVIYASETGLDDDPDVVVVLSDFPDCAALSAFSGTCTSSDEVLEISKTNTQPTATSLTTSFRYNKDGGGTETYTASELYSLGMSFSWSDTCAGNNFIETDGDGNQSAVETSTQVAPSFYKTNLSEESCQITLQLTNSDGLSDTYQYVINYTDTGNNDSDELNCDDDPGSTSPKVTITCPDEMTSVPGEIIVETCDAQGDLSYMEGHFYLWTWYTSNVGKTQYGKLIGYNYDYVGNSVYMYLGGSSDSATIPFVPYHDTSYTTDWDLIQSTYGGDILAYVYNYDQEDILTPIGGYAYVYVYDTSGHYSTAYCTFPIAEGIDLDIP